MFSNRNLNALASMVAGGNPNVQEEYFQYRSAWKLTEFFQDCGHDVPFDNSSRVPWTAEQLRLLLSDPAPPNSLPTRFLLVIRELMLKDDTAEGGDRARPEALAKLNRHLRPEGFEAFYGEDENCYVRNTKTAVVFDIHQGRRAMTDKEREREKLLIAYLDVCSEDDLIEKVLTPLFKQLNFQRISVPGHPNMLEFGKDMWMRYRLPTGHSIFFAVQVKKGTVDARGKTRGENVNAAELLTQAQMALKHPVHDPETNKQVLVDHVYLIAGGTITPPARMFIIGELDRESRRHIIFMDRLEIVDLFATSTIPLPQEAMPKPEPRGFSDDLDDDVPF
ncbi:hypothetical protein [Sphingomonas asaccharolytica]|uniref:hypothetical protein n=1 Tax=Sphingomonas asaccharolytica TaxID=40681 RepID=UPI000B19145B|nr:hypothetical protein [Sphingomonas asaccharolytica]